MNIATDENYQWYKQRDEKQYRKIVMKTGDKRDNKEYDK